MLSPLARNGFRLQAFNVILQVFEYNTRLENGHARLQRELFSLRRAGEHVRASCVLFEEELSEMARAEEVSFCACGTDTQDSHRRDEANFSTPGRASRSRSCRCRINPNQIARYVSHLGQGARHIFFGAHRRLLLD
jgi:hypothetical protein